MLSETVGPYNAIGRIAMAEVEAALDAGWRVTVVAKRLDEALVARVEWVRLFVPPRGFALQWLTARRFFKRAIGRRLASGEFDIVHGHQPQIADLCDVFECHYLTRAAYERRCLETRASVRGRSIRLQQQLVLHAEDWFYRRWNPSTWMLFNSELTRQEFARLYDSPSHEQVFGYPAPAWDPVTAQERVEARKRYLQTDAADRSRVVVGFLGGLDERKGFRQLVPAIEQDPGLYLLMGGSHSDEFSSEPLRGRYRAVGLVETRSFYAACDVLVVPSVFEPLGLVAYEAVARGIPVIATDGVGALPALRQRGLAWRWDSSEPLEPCVRAALAANSELTGKARQWCEASGSGGHYSRLLQLYEDVASRRQEDPSRSELLACSA